MKLKFSWKKSSKILFILLSIIIISTTSACNRCNKDFSKDSKETTTNQNKLENDSLSDTNDNSNSADNSTDNSLGNSTDHSDIIQSEILSNTDYQLIIDGSNSYEISDLLYGLFLEDINFAIDGGLYAELVKNRSFEYGSMAKDEGFHGYSIFGGVSYEIIDGSVDQSYLNVNNTHYLRIKNPSNDFGGIINEGFLDGMNISQNSSYEFNAFLRTKEPMKIIVELKDDAGNIFAESCFLTNSNEWWKYSTTLTTNEKIPKNAKLYVLIPKGFVDIDMVSFFPTETFKGRKNGLRKDLASSLEELSPKFLRFPGGCVVEGETLENAYQWKDSIGNGLKFFINGEITYGDIATRPLSENIWGNENTASDHPYYMTYGIGFYEYFLLSEDLKCEPIPIVNAGLSCQIQGTKTIGTAYEELEVDSPEFKQYVQDALDLVEFCKGDKTTTWGAVRIAMGHEEPFDLTYIGIGNEQWGNSYFTRYEAFKDAFEKAAINNPSLYGAIQLIVANGPTANDKYAWNKVKLYGPNYASLVDEHYYMEPSWFLSNTNRYDTYDRSNTPVFLGEYAAKSNTMEAALSEAAFMTGLERNGDIVKLSSYAPLFGNSINYQWAPDLIWFKSKQMWKSANYYVQKLFSNNKGTHVLHSTLNDNSISSNTLNDSSNAFNPSDDRTNTNIKKDNSVYHVVSTDETNAIIIKLVNTHETPKDIYIQLKDIDPSASTAEISLITAESVIDINTVTEPDKISIDKELIELAYKDFNSFVYQVPKYSVVVIRIPRIN